MEGATSYYVYRGNKFLFRTSELEGTDKEVKVPSGVKYTYRVIAAARVGKVILKSKLQRTTTYYRLMPVAIRSLRNKKPGQLTVSYDKGDDNKYSGYVIRFGLKSDMSDAKLITVKGAGTLSRTLTGLKKGKTYYVQVRTYRLENGFRYYSAYSTTKSLKITR